MKKLFTLFRLLVAGLAFISCSSHLELEQDFKSSRQILFSVKSQSLSSSDLEESSFKVGDEIGLFVTVRTDKDKPEYPTEDNCIGKNLRLIMKESGWTPVDENNIVIWDENGTVYDFFAYFPYREGAEPTAIAGTVNQNQSAVSDYSHSDFMMAENIEGKTNTKVELVFRHMLSRIDIELAPETVSDVNSGWVNNAITSYSVNLSDGTVATGDGMDRENVQMCKTGQHTFSVLLPSQTFDAGNTVFTFSIGSKSYTVKYDGEPVNLLPGKVSRHKINIPID